MTAAVPDKVLDGVKKMIPLQRTGRPEGEINHILLSNKERHVLTYFSTFFGNPSIFHLFTLLQI